MCNSLWTLYIVAVVRLHTHHTDPRYQPTIDCGVKKPPGAEVDQHGVEESSIVQYWPITVSFLRVYLHLACTLFQGRRPSIIYSVRVARPTHPPDKKPESDESENSRDFGLGERKNGL